MSAQQLAMASEVERSVGEGRWVCRENALSALQGLGEPSRTLGVQVSGHYRKGLL